MNTFRRIKRVAKEAFGHAKKIESVLINQGKLHALQNRPLRSIENLSEIEFRVFSQWGEDGILDWLIERLPGIPETFLEFGVEDYRESNTRFLLWARNWRGVVIDGSRENIASIQSQDVAWRFDLKPVHSFVTTGNINQNIMNGGLQGEIGILSVDIDGNDYWVWNAISVIDPVIVVCEFNAVFGDTFPVTVPYDASFQRSQEHFSNLYFGASIAALVGLAERKGYKFVGTNSNGVNAFFVRADRAAEVITCLRETKTFGSRFSESRDASGGLNFLRGLARYEEIRHLPVVDLRSGEMVPLEALGRPYSAAWEKYFY